MYAYNGIARCFQYEYWMQWNQLKNKIMTTSTKMIGHIEYKMILEDWQNDITTVCKLLFNCLRSSTKLLDIFFLIFQILKMNMNKMEEKIMEGVTKIEREKYKWVMNVIDLHVVCTAPLLTKCKNGGRISMAVARGLHYLALEWPLWMKDKWMERKQRDQATCFDTILKWEKKWDYSWIKIQSFTLH